MALIIEGQILEKCMWEKNIVA